MPSKKPKIDKALLCRHPNCNLNRSRIISNNLLQIARRAQKSIDIGFKKIPPPQKISLHLENLKLSNATQKSFVS